MTNAINADLFHHDAGKSQNVLGRMVRYQPKRSLHVNLR